LEARLTYLFALQNVDTQLMEILEMKGDLPAAVDTLEQSVNESAAKLHELTEMVKQLKIQRDTTDTELIGYAEKIEKYKGQQLQVKSNKQYDALTKEIETVESNITQDEKNLQLYEGKIQLASQDIETLTHSLNELRAELEEKQLELAEVNKEHEIEESRLVHAREKILARIAKEDLVRYDRIRKAKDGTAIVGIKRNACGGCFNRVPPQKLLELRQNNRIFMCEHCGRILVSDSVVEKSATII